MYYAFIGCIITVSVGWIVSYIAGSTESDLYDEQLLHPMALRISKLFPGAPRRYADKTITPAPDANANDAKPVPTVSLSVNSNSSMFDSLSDPPHGIYRTKL